MKFAAFITEQQGRADAVGRLARYLVSVKPRIGGYAQIKHFLIEDGASDDLHVALESAFDEFALAVSRRQRRLALDESGA